MKRFIGIVLSFFILISIVCCGCSQYKCRDEAKKIGESAVFYAEQYINGIITAEQAYEHISTISDRLDKYCKTTHDDNLDVDTALCETTLNIAVNTLYYEFLNEILQGGKITEIKDTLEDIKKYISY